MSRPNLFRRIAAAVKKFGFKQWFLLILNAALILGSLACALGLRSVSGTLSTLTAAKRFQGEGETRFAQLACYLPVGDGKTEEDVRSFRQSLESKLVEQSLEAPEGGRLYLDAYYGMESVTIRSDNGSNSTVKAVGAGGDFFYFHPLHLRSGSYIQGDDLLDDLVLLDEELAWKLFGGTELAGLTVYINSVPFVVSGVVAREADFATEKAYTGDGGLYMSFSAMSRLIEEASITGYEIVMPNPISGYAKSLLSEVFPIGTGDIVENSGRYGLLRLSADCQSPARIFVSVRKESNRFERYARRAHVQAEKPFGRFVFVQLRINYLATVYVYGYAPALRPDFEDYIGRVHACRVRAGYLAARRPQLDNLAVVVVIGN